MKKGKIRIIQTYHGSGGREGYKYEVYEVNEVGKQEQTTKEYKKIGEFKNLPIHPKYIEISNKLYEVTNIYERNEYEYDYDNETLVYELEEYSPNIKSFKAEWK